MIPDHDAEALAAASDLVGRTGARDLEVGYLLDDVPIEEADWWATAGYSGVKITEEHHRSPVAAVEALAHRLLSGAKCVHCGGLVALDEGAFFTSGQFLDGTSWSLEEALEKPHCRWTRVGSRWVRGCEDRFPEVSQPAGPNRATRRAKRRGKP